MDIYTVNLKEFLPSVELAVANLEIELDRAIKMQVKAVKFIHGYGSSGKGGAISCEVRKIAKQLKRQHKIADYIVGAEWDLSFEKTQQFIVKCKNDDFDEDINHNNNGITVFILN